LRSLEGRRTASFPEAAKEKRQTPESEESESRGFGHLRQQVSPERVQLIDVLRLVERVIRGPGPGKAVLVIPEVVPL